MSHMIGPIAKIMSGEYGPFDRIVELGVFTLIAYEVGVGVVRHRWALKRQRELENITKILSDFMFKGQTLQQTVPDSAKAAWPAHEEWMVAVADWSVNTVQFLSARSQRASASFLLVVSSSDSDSEIIPLDGYSVRLSGIVRQRYQLLVGHLSNLRSIIEKPEAYF